MKKTDRFAVYAIRGYRLFAHIKHRVLFTAFGFNTTCRHTPSCSRYAEQAIKEHGTIGGLLRATARVLTCW